MKRILILMMSFAFLISACTPNYSTAIIPTPDIVLYTPTALPAESPTPVSGGGYPAALFAAQKLLSEKLGVPVDQIQVDRVEPVEWPDSCLGLARSDEMCAEVITPGYRILLRVDLVRYEFHTNADGSSIRQAPSVDLGTSGEETRPVLTWEDAACDQLSVTLDLVSYGRCGENLVASPEVTPSSLEKVTQWIRTFAAFEAETQAGKISFHGFGPNIATSSEQRMLAEWAQLTYSIAQSGRTGAAWGMAFAYHREGGIAGFCDDVVVYLAGYAAASSCGGTNALINLTASQLQQVYDWFDSYRLIDYSYTDPAVADAMTITLAMPGRGDRPADEEAIRSITEFASDLLAQASFERQADPAALESAQGAISDFLAALHSGDYILAAKLYGGETSILQDWNPDITNDLPAWLERGCTQNGLMCLTPRSLTYRGPDADGALQFLVEYNNPDGTLFQQGPCCGDESGAVNTSFLVRARQQDDLWLVLDLPPYVP